MFRNLIDKAPVAVSISRNGKTVYVNQKYLEQYGFSSLDEVVGKPIFDQWAPESREIIRKRAEKRMRGEPAPTQYVETGLRKDGSRFPVSVAVQTVNLPDGPAFMAFLTDITEQKRAEESNLLFKNLLNQSNDAIFVLDPATGLFLDVNDKACSDLGYERNELLAMRTMDIEAKGGSQLAPPVVSYPAW